MVKQQNRIMVVAPHFDDESLGCGGVLQRFTSKNAIVAFASERKRDKRFDGTNYVPYRGNVREEEMNKVAKLLGYTPIRLGFPLHALDTVPLEKIIDKFETLIRDFCPGVILAPADSHDNDHNIIWHVIKSIMRPHFWNGSVLRYFTWGVPSPLDSVVYVPLSKEECRIKYQAITLYRTQCSPGDKFDKLYPYSATSVVRLK
jgi:N-acetylglucosamine malate deacetylase 1